MVLPGKDVHFLQLPISFQPTEGPVHFELRYIAVFLPWLLPFMEDSPGVGVDTNRELIF